MKSTSHALGAIAVFSLLGCITLKAAAWTDKLYLNADIGPTYFPDTPTRLATPPYASFSTSKGVMKNQTGIRSDLALGYNLGERWSVEAEGGVIWSPSPEASDSDFYQIPIMVNVLYHIPLSKSFRAYLGGGVGETEGFWDGEVRTASFHTPIHLSADDWSFSYGAEAGVKYAPSQHLEVGLGYKFIGVAGYDWTLTDVSDPSLKDRLTTGTVYAHTISFSLTWKF
jgi:opacity protein-like surface antigen